MSTVEIETGTYIKRFAFWNPATWSIPKLYWDAWSQEQRLHAICRQLEKVIKYADYLGVNVDDIAARLKAIEEGQLDPIIEAAIEDWFEEHAPSIVEDVADLQIAVSAINDEIGEGFSSENTVADAIANEATAREQAIEDEASARDLAIADKAENIQRFIPKQEYLPIVTDGWLSLDSGYHSTSAGYSKPWMGAGMTTKGNNQIFMVARYSNSDNGAIYVFDRELNTYQQVKDVVKVGHANDMSYCPDNNKFYILPGMSNIDQSDPAFQNVVFEYNPAFTELIEHYCPDSWGAMGYDYVTGKLTLAGRSGGVYDYDTATGEFVQREEITLDPIPEEIGFIGQGGGINDDFAYFAHGWNGIKDDNLVCVYDLRTGKLAKTYLLPLASDVFPVGEIQDISFSPDGTMYLLNSCPFDRENVTASINCILKSGVATETPFGHMYNSLVPDSVRVEPLNAEYYPTPVSTQFVFRTINEALAYVKYHKVKSIVLYPSNSDNNYYWFNEMVDLEGMGDIVFENPHSHVGIIGAIYARGGVTLRWVGELHIGMPYNLAWGSKIALYLNNSTFIGSYLTINQGYDTAVRYGLLMEGASAYYGLAAPYLSAGVTGTAYQDNSTCGHRFVKQEVDS